MGGNKQRHARAICAHNNIYSLYPIIVMNKYLPHRMIVVDTPNVFLIFFRRILHAHYKHWKQHDTKQQHKSAYEDVLGSKMINANHMTEMLYPAGWCEMQIYTFCFSASNSSITPLTTTLLSILRAIKSKSSRMPICSGSLSRAR